MPSSYLAPLSHQIAGRQAVPATQREDKKEGKEVTVFGKGEGVGVKKTTVKSVGLFHFFPLRSQVQTDLVATDRKRFCPFTSVIYGYV